MAIPETVIVSMLWMSALVVNTVMVLPLTARRDPSEPGADRVPPPTVRVLPPA